MLECEREMVDQVLEDSIETVRKLLTKHEKYLSGNETATRILIIDPVLTALGWDVRCPKFVKLEQVFNGNKTDYILLQANDGILAVVEAKPVYSALPRHQKQASGYATEVGAPYTILTNGVRWEAWEMVPLRPRNENVFVEVSLTTGNVKEIASTLRKLARGVIGK